MLFPILGLVGFAGVVLFAVWLIIAALRDKKIMIPFVGMLVFALLVGASVFMISREDSEPADKSSGDQSTVDRSEPDRSNGDKSDTSADKSSEPSDSSGENSSGKDDKPSQTKSESWEVTYKNSIIYKNSLDDIACYAIVEVENTGTVDLYLDDATFDFEDENGKLLATYSTMISSDPDIIAPGEKGYFYCNMATLDRDITENTEYVFNPSLKIKKSQKSIVRYNISDLSISDGGFLSPFSVIGRIENNTGEDAGLVWICCIAYRNDGTPIAACGTNITDLGAGEKTSFNLSASHLMNLDVKLSDIADYKVYACKTQYQF